jgi:hypothetical protein
MAFGSPGPRDSSHLIQLIFLFGTTCDRMTKWRGVRLPILIALAALLLAGCQSVDNPGMNAMIVTAKAAISPGGGVDEIALTPGLGYLRVTYNGSLALFALAYLDQDQNGVIEVYYGPNASLLRLQNGHVLALLGTSTEWRAVSLSANPAFLGSSSTTLERVRDVQPGDQFGRRDKIAIRPANSDQEKLKGIDPAILHWYAEESEDLPLGRVAVTSADVPVYGEQWIDAKHLLTWQLWPVSAIHPLP